MHPRVLAVVAIGGVLFPARARAGEQDTQQMVAEALFDEGRQLMDRGKYAEACPKLAESQRLDPAGGTLLNLAICYEKEGRYGTAYLEMKAALSQAAKDGRKDRERIASEHLTALGARVPHLAVHVVRDEPNLDVKLDGTVVRKPAWDVFTVIDPGPHVVDASAPGKSPFRQTITLREGEQRTVMIPALPTANGSGDPASASAYEARDSRQPSTTNPWFVASAVVGVTGFTVGVTGAWVWGMTKLTDSACHPLNSAGSDSMFCISDGVRTTWLVTAVVGLLIGGAGTIGLVTLPSKVQVAPATTSNGGGGGVIVGTF